ncbi:MAG TPA: hypothetical protein VF855_06375 [Acidimicrobiales bacterium]
MSDDRAESAEAPAAVPAPAEGGDVRDSLPADLDITGMVGPYKVPDNSRRRIPGLLYLGLAAVAVLIWLWKGDDGVLVNKGFLVAAGLLTVAGIISLTSGWRMHLDEKEALLAATKAVGFPVGHASAQLSWRGLRSRPTWRILCYSAEDPPHRRGFVLVDAVDGRIVEHLVEDNPEKWASAPSE